jgi:signal transduction histidine kinase
MSSVRKRKRPHAAAAGNSATRRRRAEAPGTEPVSSSRAAKPIVGLGTATPTGDPELVGQLKSALLATKKEHEHLIRELAGQNEKVKAAHEEVVAVNEELQATNEELTASKEELQSMNEELTTLNTQLEANVAELTAANDDLANLLLSTDDTTVIVDTELRIKRFTLAAARLLNLLPTDSGRSLTHIATNLVDVDLPGQARAVLADLQPVAKEVATRDGRQYFLRALPYRTGERHVQGVVLTLVDLSTLRQMQQDLQAARERLAGDLSRMTRLHELGERLALAGEQRLLLEEILGAAIEITDAAMGSVQELNAAGALTISAQLGFEQSFLDFFAQIAPDSDSAWSRALSSRERVLVEDVTTSALFADSPSRQVLLAAGVRAVQSTPLRDRSGQFLGMFSTHYRAPHRFEEPELRWLDLLARHAADAIERWRVDEALRRSREDLEHRVAERTEWLTLLNQVSESINDAPTWDSALHRVLERICATGDWQVGYVYLPDPEAPTVIAPAITCIGNERFRPFHEVSERQRYARGESLPGRVYAQGVSKYAEEAGELMQAIPIRAAAAREVGLQAGVAHAITSGQEMIAVLELFSDRAHPRNDWFDNLLPAVADQIRRILERERTTARMADLVWREQQDLLHTLHDALGQTLTGLGMLSMGLRQRLSASHGGAADAAAEIARQAQHALEQVRQLSRSLFPVEVEAASLTAALRELAFATQSLHKIQVRVEGRVPETFSDGGAATQLYRIAQEAVTNAVKHAGARTITIHVGRQASMMRLRIADDGIGIGKGSASSGVGLQIMRYRAHSIGGILIVEPGAQSGTVVTCTLRTVPVHKAAHASEPQDPKTQTGSTRD